MENVFGVIGIPVLNAFNFPYLSSFGSVLSECECVLRLEMGKAKNQSLISVSFSRDAVQKEAEFHND